MTAIAFDKFTVTTWRVNEYGEQVWRARDSDGFVEFVADRNAPWDLLYRLGQVALRDSE
jgi:hypothetical protein